MRSERHQRPEVRGRVRITLAGSKRANVGKVVVNDKELEGLKQIRFKRCVFFFPFSEDG